MKPILVPVIVLFVFIIIAVSCKKTNNTLTLGASYGGGIVAYILQPGDPGYTASVQHGLIAAPGDQKTGMPWGNYLKAYAPDTALGSGQGNTDSIVIAVGAGSAAYVCYYLTLGGYSDWHLPSKSELNKLYIFNVNQPAVGDFASAIYWSSSEAGSDSAWAQNFEKGAQGSLNKYDTFHVRAIRAF